METVAELVRVHFIELFEAILAWTEVGKAQQFAVAEEIRVRLEQNTIL